MLIQQQRREDFEVNYGQMTDEEYDFYSQQNVVIMAVKFGTRKTPDWVDQTKHLIVS